MQTYYAKTLYDLVKQYIPNGIHIYHCITNDIEIEFQIINYNDDVILNTPTTFGNTTADTQMLILKFNKNLTIDSGITLIPQVRKKGMVVYVSGTLINNEYIYTTEEDIQEQQEETVVEENSTMKALLKVAIAESLSNNGLTS